MSKNKGLSKKDFWLAEGNEGTYAEKHCKHYPLSDAERRQMQELSPRMWKAYDKKPVRLEKQQSITELPTGVQLEAAKRD